MDEKQKKNVVENININTEKPPEIKNEKPEKKQRKTVRLKKGAKQVENTEKNGAETGEGTDENKKVFVPEEGRILKQSEKENLVRLMVELLFENDQYLPERYQYVYWCCMSQVYLGHGGEVDSDTFMREVYEGDLKERVRTYSNAYQRTEIEDALEQRIEMKCKENKLEKAVAEILNDLREIDFSGVIGSVQNLIKRMSEINADEIVNAYMKQK